MFTATLYVSIHAAAWAATISFRRVCQSSIGFNPRGRMGRDPERHDYLLHPAGFNPRGRMGRDPQKLPHFQDSRVSIHAAAWAATGETPDDVFNQPVSIHAAAWAAT